MRIDFRSDTVTQPCDAMLDRMRNAPVGDAIFGDDPSVNALEEYAAGLFGRGRALFCPSGTMTNQIAIKAHTAPGDQLICDKTAHVYIYEGGGAAMHSGVSCRLLAGDRGRFTPEQVAEAINKDDPHFPRTRLVSIENSSNKGGGTCWDFSQITQIKELCQEKGLYLHLDGARLFNALVESNEPIEESLINYGKVFDSISICLSKGLGAPIGSILIGDGEFIHRADRARKAFGGGMRQAGYLAAAGQYALENNIERLALDHEKARQLSEAFAKSSLKGRAWQPVTNIVIFEFDESSDLVSTLGKLAELDVQAQEMGSKLLRLVTHMDVTDEMVDRMVSLIKNL